MANQTDSKQGQQPLFYIEIVYKPEFDGYLGDLRRFLSTSYDDKKPIRYLDNITVDFAGLSQVIEQMKQKGYVDKVIGWAHPFNQKINSLINLPTYFIPPRTTISGVVAGLLGIERDEYYDAFSVENCDIALACLNPIKKYFAKLKRTRFIPELEKEMNTRDFVEFFMEKWNISKSAAIVVNTIKRSIEIFYALKDEFKRRCINMPVYYLSTNIIPSKRRMVIDEVDKLLKANEPVILVSTQTIEAGVDLDFDMAFRDFAPLDSLVQTAGRVNRNGSKG